MKYLSKYLVFTALTRLFF